MNSRLTPLIAAFGVALFLISCSGDATTSEQELATEARPVSFADDVKPIIESSCTSCHTGNGPGATHLRMDTAGDIANAAEFAAFKVETQAMPPWPATDRSDLDFKWDLSLADQQRQTILNWVEQGAVLDVDLATALDVTAEGFPETEPDIVAAADEEYRGEDAAIDDYRCRVIDPNITSDGFIKSLAVEPDEQSVLHHGVVFLADASGRGGAEDLDGADGRPGWSCQTVPRLAGGELFQVTAWAPGTGPFLLPSGTGVPISEGDFFVVQWHYHYDGEALGDNSALAVDLYSQTEIDALPGGVSPIHNEIILGPVEIPCRDDESGPLCDRDAALERISREFGEESTFIPFGVNLICGVTPEDFASFTDGKVTSHCDVQAPNGSVIALWPHMHELGTKYRMTLNPDTPDERVLLDIDRWDFNWQTGYFLDEELTLNGDDVIRVECSWDRALWPAGLESRYVVWAEGTQDEMCYSVVTVRE